VDREFDDTNAIRRDVVVSVHGRPRKPRKQELPTPDWPLRYNTARSSRSQQRIATDRHLVWSSLDLPFEHAPLNAMRLFGLVAGSALLASAADASSLQPPVLPLIVRNPYLSTWLQNAREEPWSKWPMFWTGSEVWRVENCNTTDSDQHPDWLQRSCFGPWYQPGLSTFGPAPRFTGEGQQRVGVSGHVPKHESTN
jgi:hypothetical protein